MCSFKIPKPYRKRILYYCETQGILVPNNFDIAQSSEALVAIDITEIPHQLAPASTFLWKEVLKYIRTPTRNERKFKILDFKRGCELVMQEDRLVRGKSFEHKIPNESQLREMKKNNNLILLVFLPVFCVVVTVT